MHLGPWECEVEFGRDHGEAWVVGAVGVTTGLVCTPEFCDQLTDWYAEDLEQERVEHWMGEAEARADAWRDGSM